MIGIQVLGWTAEKITGMPKTEQTSSARPRSREGAPVARPEPVATETELSEAAIRAIEEGRADHAAGRRFSMAEIKQELRKESGSGD